MRIQRLRISAFGPFAEPVDLDFAALNDAGLFLLTGSNGAGKSSILDAVCFALYGAVPGERNAARRFRSDHAGPGEAPMVELEAGFSAGTYRIVRTPAWERPKRRGIGTTPQQSTVSVSRRVGDGWQPVTSRLDEAGQLMTRLVGMNLTQFCQVVILPQGQFQAFLQSTATERQALLQQLFHTGRFQRVEAWLRDHRLALRRNSADHETGVRELVNRISEVAQSPVPETDDADDPLRWAGVLLDELGQDLAAVTERAGAASADETRVRGELEAGRDLAARVSRHHAALAEQASLAASAASIQPLRISVDAARRAVPVAVLTPLVVAREAAFEAASSAHVAATERLVAMLGEAPDDLRAETEALRRTAVRFEALVPRAEESASLRHRLDTCADESDAIEARHHELDTSDIGVVIDVLTSRREGVRAAQLALPEVRATIEEVRTRLRAHEQAEILTSAHESAVSDLRVATARALDAKDAWLTLREARIDGMAAELAGALAVGAGCPVCGSAEHPHPAEPHPDAPDAEAERAAQRRVDDANTAQHLHDLKVRELAAAIDQASASAGDTPVPELRATLDEGRARARHLAETVDSAAALETELTAAVERCRAELLEAQELGTRRAVLQAQRGDLAGRVAVLDRELNAALTDTPYADARAAHIDTADRLRTIEAARGAGHDLDEAGRALAESHGARATAALEAGFASAADAEQSLLRPAELTALDLDLTRHDARVAAVAALLADPELADLAGVEPPDVAALQSVHGAAEAARTRADAEVADLRGRWERLGTLIAELSDRDQAWDPVRRQLELATHLSAFCEGKAADNRWQIQLSAYVVAWRLSQVADAANLRLAVMTHGRYSLEHTDLAGAGERRGGMTLVVRDDWTGVTRDPVTLSGGETFVVALALALGLADVITAEAGGASLQTLFVDEGFGMLDTTSLDLVMDTLDSLRESGRTVGVVSHVAEMSSRIPVQVQVHKPHDHGPSTVRLRA